MGQKILNLFFRVGGGKKLVVFLLALLPLVAQAVPAGTPYAFTADPSLCGLPTDYGNYVWDGSAWGRIGLRFIGDNTGEVRYVGYGPYATYVITQSSETTATMAITSTAYGRERGTFSGTILLTATSGTWGYTPSTFPLTVAGGTGSGDYAPLASVQISAQAPAGQVFAAWTGTGLDVLPILQTSTIIMPARPVDLTAHFVNGVSSLSVTVNNPSKVSYAVQLWANGSLLFAGAREATETQFSFTGDNSLNLIGGSVVELFINNVLVRQVTTSIEVPPETITMTYTVPPVEIPAEPTPTPTPTPITLPDDPSNSNPTPTPQPGPTPTPPVADPSPTPTLPKTDGKGTGGDGTGLANPWGPSTPSNPATDAMTKADFYDAVKSGVQDAFDDQNITPGQIAELTEPDSQAATGAAEGLVASVYGTGEALNGLAGAGVALVNSFMPHMPDVGMSAGQSITLPVLGSFYINFQELPGWSILRWIMISFIWLMTIIISIKIIRSGVA